MYNALSLLDRDDWHLHVYSSYCYIQNDEPFQHLFDKIDEHPNMTSYVQFLMMSCEKHGKRCIYWRIHQRQETSCRVAMEAMSAHCAVVTSNWVHYLRHGIWLHVHIYRR